MKSLVHLIIIAIFVLIQSEMKAGNGISKFRALNSVSLEILGSTGSVAGYCYDRVITENNNSFWSFTTGLGYFPALDAESQPIVGIPGIINFATGLTNSHFELGFGFIYSSGLRQEWFINNRTGEKFSWKLEGVFLSSRIGYRLQIPTGGFLFKIGIMPMYKIIDLNGDYPEITLLLNPGITFGWSF